MITSITKTFFFLNMQNFRALVIRNVYSLHVCRRILVLIWISLLFPLYWLLTGDWCPLYNSRSHSSWPPFSLLGPSAVSSSFLSARWDDPSIFTCPGGESQYQVPCVCVWETLKRERVKSVNFTHFIEQNLNINSQKKPN